MTKTANPIRNIARSRLFTLAARLACFLLGSALGISGAAAAVVDTFSVTPPVISPGDQSTLNLQLILSSDSGDYGAFFTGGSVTLNDGLGDSQVFNIANGGTSQDFSYTFVYPTSGQFTPSFSFVADYQEYYTYYYQEEVQTGGYYYSCGFLETCYQPTYTLETFSNTETYDPTQYGSGNDSVTVTPLPATLPLFGGGLGALGLLGWRRKRKSRVSLLGAA